MTTTLNEIDFQSQLRKYLQVFLRDELMINTEIIFDFMLLLHMMDDNQSYISNIVINGIKNKDSEDLSPKEIAKIHKAIHRVFVDRNKYFNEHEVEVINKVIEYVSNDTLFKVFSPSKKQQLEFMLPELTFWVILKGKEGLIDENTRNLILEKIKIFIKERIENNGMDR